VSIKDMPVCDPLCVPKSMMGGSWWKRVGFNGPCRCAFIAINYEGMGE